MVLILLMSTPICLKSIVPLQDCESSCPLLARFLPTSCPKILNCYPHRSRVLYSTWICQHPPHKKIVWQSHVKEVDMILSLSCDHGQCPLTVGKSGPGIFFDSLGVCHRRRSTVTRVWLLADNGRLFI
jgi:hypothetical protein